MQRANAISIHNENYFILEIPIVAISIAHPSVAWSRQAGKLKQ